HWIGSETPDHGPTGLKWRVHDLISPHFTIGPFPFSWLVVMPSLFRGLPPALRDPICARCLRPAGTPWLRPRSGDRRVTSGCTVRDARPTDAGVSLTLDSGVRLEVDHVLLATGYWVDIAKYRMLAPELLHRIDCVDGSPVLSAGFESSVPGLHFIGSS